MEHLPELLTVKQAADLLGLAASTIRAWILNGKIEVVHIGRLVKIPRRWCDDYIAANTTPAKMQNDGRSATDAPVYLVGRSHSQTTHWRISKQ